MKPWDETQSYEEGWVVSTCFGSAYFPEGWMHIEKHDEFDIFPNDDAALAFVASEASSNFGGYHAQALSMIEHNNFKLIDKDWKHPYNTSLGESQ